MNHKILHLFVLSPWPLQFDVPNSGPWDREVDFGVCCSLTCGVHVLGEGFLLPVSPIGHGHWKHHCIPEMRVPRSVQFNAVMGKLAGRYVEVAVKNSVRDYGLAHALLSAWPSSFKVYHIRRWCLRYITADFPFVHCDAIYQTGFVSSLEARQDRIQECCARITTGCIDNLNSHPALTAASALKRSCAGTARHFIWKQNLSFN